MTSIKSNFDGIFNFLTKFKTSLIPLTIEKLLDEIDQIVMMNFEM